MCLIKCGAHSHSLKPVRSPTLPPSPRAAAAQRHCIVIKTSEADVDAVPVDVGNDPLLMVFLVAAPRLPTGRRCVADARSRRLRP